MTYYATTSWSSNYSSSYNVPLVGTGGALAYSSTQSFIGTSLSVPTSSNSFYAPVDGLYNVELFLASGSTTGFTIRFFNSSGTQLYSNGITINTAIPVVSCFPMLAGYYFEPLNYTSGTVTIALGSYMRLTLIQPFI